MLKRLARYLSKTAYGQSVIHESADLEIFKQKPTPKMIWGLVVIGISYTIGWPVIGFLGITAAYLQRPMILVVGGPVAYGLSHVTFMLGAWLAGVDHAKAFFRWATRLFILKYSQEA